VTRAIQLVLTALATLSLVYACTYAAVRADNIIRSATWHMTASCTGFDQVYRWRITAGPGTAQDWRIRPWLERPLTIRGVELEFQPVGYSLWAMMGNNAVEDDMLWLGRGETHGRTMFPAGLGMPLPKQSAAKDSDYLDLHGACIGLTAHAFYTIFYTVDRE
jgi:hypothetical protein